MKSCSMSLASAAASTVVGDPGEGASGGGEGEEGSKARALLRRAESGAASWSAPWAMKPSQARLKASSSWRFESTCLFVCVCVRFRNIHVEGVCVGVDSGKEGLPTVLYRDGRRAPTASTAAHSVGDVPPPRSRWGRRRRPGPGGRGRPRSQRAWLCGCRARTWRGRLRVCVVSWSVLVFVCVAGGLRAGETTPERSEKAMPSPESPSSSSSSSFHTRSSTYRACSGSRGGAPRPQTPRRTARAAPAK